MGQYYHPVILDADKKTVLSWMYSHDFGSGLKLMEHSYLGNDFVGAFESLLVGNPQHVVWAGDYADACPKLKTKVYDRCTDKTKISLNKISPQTVDAKFIVNHTKKQFIDKSKVPSYNGGWQIHPLPLMTCEGNGSGGGDFYEKDLKGLIGSWARDLISVENEVPKGFKEIRFNFIEGIPDKKPRAKNLKKINLKFLKQKGLTEEEANTLCELFGKIKLTEENVNEFLTGLKESMGEE